MKHHEAPLYNPKHNDTVSPLPGISYKPHLRNYNPIYNHVCVFDNWLRAGKSKLYQKQTIFSFWRSGIRAAMRDEREDDLALDEALSAGEAMLINIIWKTPTCAD